jgi:DNA-binding transcriptional LysR family regulator
LGQLVHRAGRTQPTAASELLLRHAEVALDRLTLARAQVKV